MTFPLRGLYKTMVMQLVGKKLQKGVSFGPALVQVETKDGQIVDMKVHPPFVLLGFFQHQGGQEQLRKTIDKLLESMTDTGVVLLAHEAHSAVFNDDISPEVAEAMTQKGLQFDPRAKNIIFVSLFHKSGNLTGLLPITVDRFVEYADPIEDLEVHHTKIDADNTIH